MKKFLKYGNIKNEILEEGYNARIIVPALELHNKLGKDKKYKLLKLFFDSYYNTDHDTEEFACEYYSVVDLIINKGIIPLELEYLNVDEMQEDIIGILKGDI